MHGLNVVDEVTGHLATIELKVVVAVIETSALLICLPRDVTYRDAGRIRKTWLPLITPSFAVGAEIRRDGSCFNQEEFVDHPSYVNWEAKKCHLPAMLMACGG